MASHLLSQQYAPVYLFTYFFICLFTNKQTKKYAPVLMYNMIRIALQFSLQTWQ